MFKNRWFLLVFTVALMSIIGVGVFVGRSDESGSKILHPTPSPEDQSQGPKNDITMSKKIFGVTVDDVENINGIVDSLSKLGTKPTVRVVFDEGQDPNYYLPALNAIEPYAYIMGELLDSTSVKQIRRSDYEGRARNYLSVLGDKVDIWEVGNEVNGEWLGSSSDVVGKIQAAYEVFHSAKKLTAVTLFYNYECWEKADHEMFTWAEKNLPEEIKSGVDYAFISYYEDGCNKYRPPSWDPVFDRLHQMFPNSKTGFGEIGTKEAEDSDEQHKIGLIEYYYPLKINSPGYVGGYFWWYFYQDMVPSDRPLWKALDKQSKSFFGNTPSS